MGSGGGGGAMETQETDTSSSRIPRLSLDAGGAGSAWKPSVMDVVAASVDVNVYVDQPAVLESAGNVHVHDAGRAAGAEAAPKYAWSDSGGAERSLPASRTEIVYVPGGSVSELRQNRYPALWELPSVS